jgi:signal transduction histidine kinase
VFDTGLGFNPYDSEKIFQRFTTAGKLGTGNEKSTGMGLYLSSKIVKAHQGILLGSSEGTNKGSTFELQLQHVA